MRRFWRDWLCVLLLFLFPLVLFAPVSIGHQTLLPADALYLFEPYRSAASTVGVTEVQNPLLADLILENYPWKQFLLDAVKARTLPLWDPYLFSGHPFLANGQHSALYPLTWIFFFIPIPRAFGIFVTIQLALAGVWMYILGRVVGANRAGALVAGLGYQLSGFMVVSVVHPMIIAGASWLPLLLALVECTVTRRRFWTQERAMLPWALLGAAALGLQTLAGHAEMTYFVLLVTGGFAGWRLIYRMLRYPRTEWRDEVLSPLVGVVIILGLGITLGAVQLIPLYTVVRDSFRQGAVTLGDVLSWAYPKRRIIAFLIPNFFGNPTHRTLLDLFSGKYVTVSQNAYGEAVSSLDWGIKNYVEGGAYLGILPLILAFIAVFLPPRRPISDGISDRSLRRMLEKASISFKHWWQQPYVPFFTALALFSLACIFGTPVYALIYALPFLNQSHSPFRWVFPLTVALSALSGLGVTTVARYWERYRSDEGKERIDRHGNGQGTWLVHFALLGAKPNLIGIVSALAIWMSMLVVIGIGVSWLTFPRIEPLASRVFWSLARAASVFPNVQYFYSYLVPWILLFALFLFLSGIVLRISQSSLRLPRVLGRLPVWEALAIPVILADLALFGKGFNPSVDPHLLDYRPPVIDFLKQDRSLWRLSTFDPEGRNTFNMNVGMLYQLQDVRGYDSLFSAQYARYMGWIEPQDLLPYNRIAPFRQLASLDSPLIDMLNVKYIITESEIPLPKYRQVYQDEAIRVYENLGVAPRAFTLPITATVKVSDIDMVHEALLTYDPRYYVIVEAAADGWSGPSPDLDSLPHDPVPGGFKPQHVLGYSINEVTVEAHIAQPAWLILTDAFAPGWKAFVRPLGASEEEEKEVSIGRVAGNFRGVLLEHSAVVRFKYTPNSLKLGVFVSFLSFMVALFLAVVWVWRLIYTDRRDQSTVHRVAKNSIAPILLTLFNRIVDFAFAALMLRILGPSNAGDYYYAINVFIWFDILTNFGLNTYLTREVARHRQQALRYVVNTTLLRVLLSFLVIPLLLGFIGVRQTLVAHLTSPASRQAIIAILLLYLGAIPYSISTGLTALFYGFEKAEYPAAITSVSTLLKVTIQTTALIAGFGIVGLAGSSIIVNLVTLILLAALAWRLLPGLHGAGSELSQGLHLWQPSERRLRQEMVHESWPLMVNHLLAMLFFKSDVFLVESILGSAALGLYSIGYKFLDALMVIPSMFTLALFPVVSRQAHNDREAMVRFYRLGAKILVLLALPAALITTFAAREMVLILGGAQYLPGAMIALRLMAWSMPLSWINGITQYALIALDQQRYLTRAYAIGFGVSLLTNIILLPHFGYSASAALHILSEAVLFVLFAIGIKRQLGAIGWYDMLGKPLLAAGVSAICAVGFLALGRGLALLSIVVVYPALVWGLGIITREERAILAPLVPHRATATASDVA